ncbi:LPS assembly protein LptD [Zobellella maritima]|uniref:LPS assembly protein LptD n=1 Tax=Zobellella maritima TaxID=2059725 RepID=UPI000E302B0D|nr:LPS assembly protein LptD [Zobellella maritima]
MKIRIIGFPLVLFTGLTPALTQAQTPEDETPFSFSRCFGHVPQRIDAPANANQAPIEVTADNLEATRDGKIRYRGEVNVTQAHRTFRADYAELDQQSRDVQAEGNIRYSDGSITVRSDQTLTSNLDNKDTTLEQARYQLHGNPGRGGAEQVRMTNNTNKVALDGASYTTCPPGEEVWELRASEVRVEQDQVFGEAWNTVLWVKEVPVFYFPYFKFPVKDQRQSGFLYPTLDISSDNGTDVSLPYYWNIAPNYDATYTPRYMSERGLMSQLELRYMPVKGQTGALYGEYLGSDDSLVNTELEDTSRWLFNWQHNARFDAESHWRASVDYTKVAGGDFNYLDDFTPPVGVLVDDQLLQSFQGGYYDRAWQLTAEVRDYQVLKPDTLAPFQLVPSLDLTGYRGYGWYDLSLNSELSQFNNDQADVFEASRLHIEPSVIVSLIEKPGGLLTAEAGAYYTHFEQDVPDTLAPYYQERGFVSDRLDTSVDRLLPKLRVRGNLVFDREAQWFEQAFTQTLEPQLQYLYVPYTDQDNIGLYDTTDMSQDYYQLFSERRFAGLDRISDANQVTAGFTSRIYDPLGTERLRLALAQTYNFVSPRVGLLPTDTPGEVKRSFLTFEGDANLDGNWFVHASAQQDTSEQQLASGNITLEYNELGKLAQIGFRHLNQEYFQDTSLENDLNQLGGTFSWPLDPQWRMIGGYYRDIELNRNIDTLIGLRYDSCCWAVSLTWEQWQKTDKLVNQVNQETSIGLRFELKGLSSLGAGNGDFGPGSQLLPYYRPFNLNN